MQSLKIETKIVVLAKDRHGRVVDKRETKNLITTAGGLAYVNAMEEVHGAGTASPIFNRIIVGRTAGSPTTPSASSVSGDVGATSADGVVSMLSGYPKVDDTANSENTGADAAAITWAGEIAAGTYTCDDIVRVAVAASTATFNGTEPLLSLATISPAQSKGASQTLTVYVNHKITTG